MLIKLLLLVSVFGCYQGVKWKVIPNSKLIGLFELQNEVVLHLGFTFVWLPEFPCLVNLAVL